MISKALPYLRQLMGCLLLMLTASATAQTDSTRIRTSVNMVGFGTTNILDTYLSQEKFTGAGMTFLNITQKERPGKRWTTIMQQEASISFADDRAELTEEMEAAYSIYCGRYITLRLPGNWRLEAGGLLNGNIGIIYNTSNSNNPAQARLSLNVMPSAVVSKPFTLFRQQFAVRYELDLPLAGVMFSPNYGRSHHVHQRPQHAAATQHRLAGRTLVGPASGLSGQLPAGRGEPSETAHLQPPPDDWRGEAFPDGLL